VWCILDEGKTQTRRIPIRSRHRTYCHWLCTSCSRISGQWSGVYSKKSCLTTRVMYLSTSRVRTYPFPSHPLSMHLNLPLNPKIPSFLPICNAKVLRCTPLRICASAHRRSGSLRVVLPPPSSPILHVKYLHVNAAPWSRICHPEGNWPTLCKRMPRLVGFKCPIPYYPSTLSDTVPGGL
jgi:hypothetical protein